MVQICSESRYVTIKAGYETIYASRDILGQFNRGVPSMQRRWFNYKTDRLFLNCKILFVNAHAPNSRAFDTLLPDDLPLNITNVKRLAISGSL
jgi:hypothetical protein